MQVLEHHGAPTSGVDQVWTLSSTASGGTIALSVTARGITRKTDPIAHDATAAAIQTALRALHNVGSSAVSCSGGALGSEDVVITFGGELAGQPITVTVDNVAATGGTGSLANTTAGVAATERGARTGAVLVDTESGALYINTGTPSTPAWTAPVGVSGSIVQQSEIASLTDNSGGATPDGTIGVIALPSALTDSTGGTASTTLAAATNTDALTDNGGGTADGTVAAITPAAAITDNSGGTNATNTIAVVSHIALSTSDTYADSAVNTAVNTAIDAVTAAIKCLSAHTNTNTTALGVIKDNFKEITTELGKQRTLNAVLINALSSLAARQAENKTAITAARDAVKELSTQLNAVTTTLQAAGVTA